MTIEPKKPAKNWTKILLVLSLGLNLAVLGFVVSVSLKGPPRRSAPQNQDAVAFLSFALPQDHRREIRRELVDRREEQRHDRENARGLRLAVIEALQAEPFDIESVEELLKSRRQQFVAMGELAHDALIRRIAALSAEERADYVKALQRDSRR